MPRIRPVKQARTKIMNVTGEREREEERRGGREGYTVEVMSEVACAFILVDESFVFGGN